MASGRNWFRVGRDQFELTKISRVERENAVRIQSFPDIIKFSPGRDFCFTGKPNQIGVNRLLDNEPLVIYRLLKTFRRQFPSGNGLAKSWRTVLRMGFISALDCPAKGSEFRLPVRGISRISNL